MLRETNEPLTAPELTIDQTDEWRDHANRWELAAIWVEPQPVEIARGPVAE